MRNVSLEAREDLRSEPSEYLVIRHHVIPRRIRTRFNVQTAELAAWLGSGDTAQRTTPNAQPPTNNAQRTTPKEQRPTHTENARP
jgi:hypothetical protein